MKTERIILRRLKMPLRHSFTTSFATFTEKPFTLIEIQGEGESGFGETAAPAFPFYNEEYDAGAYRILLDFLMPMLRSAGEISHPSEVRKILGKVKRNCCAKAALECAVWDLWCRQKGVSLAKALGGAKSEIETGVSIGIQPTPEILVQKVAESVEAGYPRIKIKIKPGMDFQYLDAVKKAFPDIVLQVDANSAYRLKDIPALCRLDDYGLLLIEQPLDSEDIVDHAKLQARLKTPVCLDESIVTAEDARKAFELGSCRIVNIKVARVGGLEESRLIHDKAQDAGFGVWCGGMLDGGIAKAFNVAIASLPNFLYPNDIPPSERNFVEDYIDRPWTMDGKGRIKVPEGPGIGVSPDFGIVNKFLLSEEAVRF